MNKNKAKVASLSLLVALTGALGLTACSSDDTAATPSDNTEVTAAVQIDVTTDLETAKVAVEEALEFDPTLTQVLLASDVDQPTQKYGLLVMPFIRSDAAQRVTGTVEIAEGNFVIEAVSAATGVTWQIDQDGSITEVTQ